MSRLKSASTQLNSTLRQLNSTQVYLNSTSTQPELNLKHKSILTQSQSQLQPQPQINLSHDSTLTSNQSRAQLNICLDISSSSTSTITSTLYCCDIKATQSCYKICVGWNTVIQQPSNCHNEHMAQSLDRSSVIKLYPIRRLLPTDYLE